MNKQEFDALSDETFEKHKWCNDPNNELVDAHFNSLKVGDRVSMNSVDEQKEKFPEICCMLLIKDQRAKYKTDNVAPLLCLDGNGNVFGLESMAIIKDF